MCVQPLLEQFRDLTRQPEQHVASRIGAGVSRRSDQALDLRVGEAGNDRRVHDHHGNAGFVQLRDGFEPTRRRAGPRLHAVGQSMVKRRD